MRAPLAIGGDGIAALAALGLGVLADVPRFILIASEIAGDDLIETYRRGDLP
jgi:riboflavin biosynthesis pyrimidine reductase